MARLDKKCRTLVGAALCVFLMQLYIGYNFVSRFGPKTEHSPGFVKREASYPAFQLSAADLLNRTQSSDGNISCWTLPLSDDVQSAIGRATSSECRQEIKDVACAGELGILYANELPRFCPLRGNSTKSYIGCFKDMKDDRDLDGVMVSLEKNNSPANCIKTCFHSGFPYAGVQSSSECWCGDSYGKHGLVDEETNCYMPCPGNFTAVCGGLDAQNIYDTGFGGSVRNNADHIKGPAVVDSEYPQPVRILFMLTLNGRALRQVKRLLKAIYHVNHYYYIHVDSRQEYLHRELAQLTRSFANIRMVPESLRFATIWGGASLLQMLLACMESSLDMIDWHWDFFVNLSESDFPIKRLEDLTAFLSANRNYNFLKSHGANTPRFIKKQGLDRTFYECEYRMWRLGDRPLPSGIRIDGGSDWICLNKQFVQYVVRSSDELVLGLKQYFKYSLLPAESFFHTVLQNSVYCSTHVDNNLHKTNWNRLKGCQCQYKHIVDWCGCSPSTYIPNDFHVLKETEHRPIYFARKFEAVISNHIVNLVESWINDTPDQELVAQSSYWQNEFHSSDSIQPGDDTPYAFYRSFARTAIVGLIRNSADFVDACRFTVIAIESAHLLYESDALSGLLVMFEASRYKVAGGRVRIESYMKPTRSFRLLDHDGIGKRLRGLEVGSSYDVKEHVFRNYASLLGPDSDFVLVHWWAPHHEGRDEGPVHLAVFDPVGRLAHVATTVVLSTSGRQYVGVHTVSLPKPLLPGLWHVLVIKEDHTVAELEFLILPYSHLGRRALTVTEAAIANGGTTETYNVTAQQVAMFRSFSKYQNEAIAGALSNASQNSKKTGGSLFSWIDGLTTQFWALQSLCQITSTAAQNSGGCDTLPDCRSTPWSSAAADPKSELDHVDHMTGRIVHRG